MSEPIQIKSDSDVLRDENRTLRSELRAANERIADLAGQIKQHSESRVIAPYEEEAIREQGRAFEAINTEMNRITKHVRDSFPASLGTAPTLSAIVIGLLDELKALRAAKRLPWWKRILG